MSAREIVLEIGELKNKVKALEQKADPPVSGKSVTCSDDWVLVMVDKNASPKDIPFSVALEYMKAGRRIARRGWMGSISITERHALLKRQDLLANDWCVLPLDK